MNAFVNAAAVIAVIALTAAGSAAIADDLDRMARQFATGGNSGKLAYNMGYVSAVDNLCPIHGFNVTDEYRFMPNLLDNSEYLNYLSPADVEQFWAGDAKFYEQREKSNTVAVCRIAQRRGIVD